MMRRATDKLAVACAALCILSALVSAGVVGPSVLDTSRRTADVERLTRENRALSERIIREGRERRDQSCKGDERDHLADVKALRRTYRFLRGPLAARQPDLAKLVIRQLPEIEREARTDSAPKFCDEPGIGLPEPDPVVPKRPRFLKPQ